MEAVSNYSTFRSLFEACLIIMDRFLNGTENNY